MAKGMRNQVGKTVVRAPMGSVLMASPSSASLPTSSVPAMMRMTQGRAAPVVVQPTTPTVEALRGR